MNVTTISPQKLQATWKDDKNLNLIDVRSEAEYRTEHVAGARHFPLDRLTPEILKTNRLFAGAGHEKTLYLTCATGFRAQQAAERLLSAGYHNLALLEGGTHGWKKSGLPMQGSGTTLSLQQQLLIATGFLLLVKVLFGYAIHELFFIAIPLLAVALIVAGITNWDGPSRLFAQLPWNQKSNGTQQEMS